MSRRGLVFALKNSIEATPRLWGVRKRREGFGEVGDKKLGFLGYPYISVCNYFSNF